MVILRFENHYKKNNISKENFVKEIQKFIKNPVVKNSKMPGAVKKFGLMPRQYFSESAIRQIAEYMYDNELERPVGFDENHKNIKGNGIIKVQIKNILRYSHNYINFLNGKFDFTYRNFYSFL